MPNHIINIVRISGKKETIAKFVKENVNAYVRENGEIANFSFQTIIPRPHSLDIESGTREENAMEFIKAGQKKQAEMIDRYNLDTAEKQEEFEELGRKALNNIKVYGFKDWYDWSIENWGTKWDAYEVSVDYWENEVSLNFQTAWSTPLPIFLAISEKYKDLNIYVEYADEDLGCNCGTLTFEGGQLINGEDKDFDFACGLWGYDPEELKAEYEEENEEEV